ncbi:MULTISPECIES: hypothetical protein [unclassified Treponema]|uniref:hypothetical protein n=1 Tax=unclassified Treponema TaxID=2638727 RepID=UPI0020A4E44E|nr:MULTISPECIES: hypothetical protein [unclassified Treponema]UTC68163.1 hypothetical protein E4O06_05885 [Treponema sp. OMZ 789]UTC70883.1 hypothetical protein E4O01_06030 [Treponema sp. OMZ 790]UTC73623.1 hypothetical protein E4O02_06225 [Treponema sp. OMZ 791]
MGLRQKAEAVGINAYRPPNAPIEWASSPFFDAKKNFKDLLKTLHIEKGGFLVKTGEDFYNLCFASGVDITTFHRCVIPAELIDSFAVEENEWYSLSDKDLKSIKSYFSSQEYISITDIFLFSIEKDKTFLFLIKSQKDVYRDSFDLQKADKDLKDFLPLYNECKFIIETARPVYPFQYGTDTIMLKIKSALNFDNTAHLLKIAFFHIFPDSVKLQSDLNTISLYYSIINKILNLMGKSNMAILGMDNCLYASIFSSETMPMELYTKKITASLTKIYGEDICSRLLMEYTGTSKNINEIKTFFKAVINDKTN